MRSRVNGKNSYKTSSEGKEILDRKDFYEWTFNETNFLELFDYFIKNNYQRKIAPSIDRIDNNGGYVLGNMQWLTVSGNSRKRNLIDY